MITFMKQEAVEKVEEIDIKAEEEFNIEKNRLINQELIKIDQNYKKKEKQIDLRRKIEHSNLANEHRLNILKAKENYVQFLKDEAQKQLIILTEDRAKYIIILANLITQGLFRLMENDITIRCRQEDYGLVQRLIPDAIRKYQQQFKQNDISVTVQKNQFLSKHL